MSARGGVRRTRRVWAFAVAAVLVLAGVLGVLATRGHEASASAPEPTGYDHFWKLQGIASGEIGRNVRVVETSDLRLWSSAGDYSGTLAYADRVGAESGDTFSQGSRIDLVLKGVRTAGRHLVAGSFVGTATLTLSGATSPEAGALPPASGVTARGVVTYRVIGRWVAEIDGDVVSGELLYDSAEPVSVRPGDALTHDASWFNRLSDEFPDNLGAPQTFAVRLLDAAPASARD
ncbi:MAG: hypothetical protein FDZ70_09275 [Actinobacteria bacterium]|nr:MAG: hypothetical protein FDZ70_09275 [Actinomycetota bacterium]